MEILALLAILLVIAVPVLSIAAFISARRALEQVQETPIQNLIARLYTLEQRIASLEKTLAHEAEKPDTKQAPQPLPLSQPPAQTTTPAIPVTQASSVPLPPIVSSRPPKPREIPLTIPPGPRPDVFAAPPLHASQTKSSSLDLETMIGGRWFNRVGITAILGAVTYFLKYAFDNNWIGPSGRVGIGILLGAAMLPWSQWLLKKGYSYFSEGIAGLGAAVLYLSVWVGCQYYTLYTRDVGFFAMIVITAAMAGVALGRNSQRLAFLAMTGGFLTPLLVSSGRNEEVVLFTYLLILGAGMLFLDERKNWRTLGPVSFVLTIFYFWGWYAQFYRPISLEITIFYATFFFLLYGALPLLRTFRAARLQELDITLAVINSAAYLLALYVLLWPQDRWPLTLFVLALSAAHVVAARLVPAPKQNGSGLGRMIYAGMALTFATLAIPIRLDGKWITLAFAIEGAILVWTGLRSETLYLCRAGYLLLVIAAARLLLFPLPADTFLINERFIAYAVLISCFGVVVYSIRTNISSARDSDMAVAGTFAVGINFFALVALSLELWDYFGRTASPGINTSLSQHLALSLLWTGYATGLILLGVNRKSALLRWQAILLFGLVVLKVFIYDSSFLERFYRIVSFFILGLVLLVISFLYQRKVAREHSSS